MQTNQNPITLVITDLENDPWANFIQELLDSHLFFAFCTSGFRGFDEYRDQSDMVIKIKSSGLYFFFKFEGSYAKKLEVTTL